MIDKEIEKILSEYTLFYWIPIRPKVDQPKNLEQPRCCMCTKNATHATHGGDYYCSFHAPDRSKAKLIVPIKKPTLKEYRCDDQSTSYEF